MFVGLFSCYKPKWGRLVKIHPGLTHYKFATMRRNVARSQMAPITLENPTRSQTTGATIVQGHQLDIYVLSIPKEYSRRTQAFGRGMKFNRSGWKENENV